MSEDRLDRIEKLLDRSINDTLELKKSQEKTDEQMKNTDKRIKETNEQMKNTDEQMKNTDKQMKKTDEQIKEMTKWLKETKALLDRTIKTLNWMWVTQWDISEDLFYSNFEILLKWEWKEIKKVIRNLDFPWKVEFDIVWVNGSEVFVAEVKTRLTKEHIDNFVKKRLLSFRKYAVEYKGYKLYWVVAWRVITKEAMKEAKDNWLYIMKELNNWNAKLLNNKGFIAKEFVF